MKIEALSASSPELVAMALEAEKRLRSHRGGPALINTITGGSDLGSVVDALLADGALWGAFSDDRLVAFAVVRSDVVEAIYVAPTSRRQGVATLMIKTLLALNDPPRDAYALPGDRAMKSLYESIGWKARLLTMRGA